MNLHSQQSCPGERDIQYRQPRHRCCQAPALKNGLSFTFHFYVQNTLHNRYAPEGSRVRWDITIPNFPFTLPFSQKPSSKPLLLTSAFLWFIKGGSLQGQVFQHPMLTLVCPFSASWSTSLDMGDQEALHCRAAVWHCQCVRGGWGTRGLLFRSGVDTKTSCSWSVCNPWVRKALAWCLLTSWGPKP